MKTIATMALTAVPIFAWAALPADAGGPLNDKGVPHPGGPQWADAVAGQNPLTTEEAAAAMAFFWHCNETGNESAETLNLEAFVADIMAGGNEEDDFVEGGKHFSLVQRHLAEFRAMADVYWAVSCFINPYSGQ